MTRLRQKDREKQKRENWTKFKQILKRKRSLRKKRNCWQSGRNSTVNLIWIWTLGRKRSRMRFFLPH